MIDPLSTYDLRLRSLDRKPGEPIDLCSGCSSQAQWSVWLHTPEWSPNGGLTLVLCHPCAMEEINSEARHATRKASPSPPTPGEDAR